MKKLVYIIIFTIIVALSIHKIAVADTKLDKIKNKIKSGENKLIGKIWGTKDCSQYSTKTFTGLANYKRCKNGMEPSDKNFFKSLDWKKDKNKEFDPNKPCHEYSTKTFTGLSAKMKCKRAKKN